MARGRVAWRWGRFAVVDRSSRENSAAGKHALSRRSLSTECAVRLRAHGVQSLELSAQAQTARQRQPMRLAFYLALREVPRKLNMVGHEQRVEARSFGRTSADAGDAECRDSTACRTPAAHRGIYRHRRLDTPE